MTVKLLTIGEFARAARLSPKALRLYDELGLLRPFRVDEWSGYRYYAPSQLERARLVAWLRRLGMPLAQIGAVVESPPAEAAAAVAVFLRVTEADFAERQRLAQFLITYLSEGATAMPEPASAASSALRRALSAAPGVPLAIRYAAASDIGLVRKQNQDMAYADPRLVAVADGFGPAGDRASAAVIDALRQFEAERQAGSTPAPAGAALAARAWAAAGVAPADLLNALSDAVSAASASVRSIVEADPDLDGTGSTLTAMLLSGSRLALVHIGDTRAYLFRDGGLFQITHDHTVTQSMVDAGRLTPEEAASHPQRSLLLRALGCSSDAYARLGDTGSAGERRGDAGAVAARGAGGRPLPAHLRRPDQRRPRARDQGDPGRPSAVSRARSSAGWSRSPTRPAARTTSPAPSRTSSPPPER